MFQLKDLYPSTTSEWENFFFHKKKKKKQDNFGHVSDLKRLRTKRDQESYSPDKLDV